MKLVTMLLDLGLLMCLTVLWRADASEGSESYRVDAEREPFESFELEASGGPTSTLFASCISAARSVEAKLYSIGPHQSLDVYIRYVPDSTQLRTDPKWTTVDPPVSSIVECFQVAYTEYSVMFKYSGGSDCKVSRQMYDLEYVPACEAQDQDAVFIMTPANTECPLPRLRPIGTDVCFSIVEDLMTLYVAIDACGDKHDSYMLGGFLRNQNYSDILTALKDMNVDPSSNFFVHVVYSGAKWIWLSNHVAVDTSLMVGPPSTNRNDYVFMNGSAGFKLDFTSDPNFEAGALCMTRAQNY